MRLLLPIALATVVAAPPKPATLTSPFSVTVEARGTLLLADGGSGRIVRVDPRTGRGTVFAEGLKQVYDVEVARDGVYASTATQVLRFAGGKKEVVVRGLHDPIGIAVARDGTLYVAEATKNRVVRFDARTRKRTVVASTGLSQPLGLALRSDGALLVADSRNGRIVRVGEGGALEPVLEGLGLPVALAAVGDGTVYVADHVEHGRAGKILRLNPDGTTDTLSAGRIKDLSGVAVGRAGVIYASSFDAPFVGRLDTLGRLRRLPAR
jgi:sugar lactone lactonase YvrE